VEFTGFTDGDFEIFSIPDFAGRMGAIRAEIRPKLVALGEDLSARVEALSGLPTFPHAALHMRRRVNPSVETWVAFGRDRKGYKRWTHYRIAISGTGVRVTVFVEDDADDKPQFGARLEKGARKLISELGKTAPVLWYTLNGDEPIPQSRLKTVQLSEAGAALQRLKTARFQAGIPMHREEAARMDPAKLEEWSLDQMAVLKPLYLAGAG
jgi:uncharacterized protein YktB (UPF0637 family)